MLDPDPVHDVTLDVHPEDVPGVGANLVGVFRQLDPARLAAAADLHLRLDHHGIAGRVGRPHRLVDGLGDAARGHGDAVAREQLLPLILEEIHELLLIAFE